MPEASEAAFSPGMDGTRLDVCVAAHLGVSRTKAAYLVVNGHVFVNGKRADKNNLLLKASDLVKAEIPEGAFSVAAKPIVPELMDLEIVYEDEGVLVVNKPSGLVSHPTPHQSLGTLANGLAFRAATGKKIMLAHRLDKDTSGLIAAGKTPEALDALQKQIRKREMKRFYLAIVHRPFGEMMGTVDAPIGHMRDESVRFTVQNARSPKPSTTNFYVLDQTDSHALVKCELQTGRTHQIRVHMAFIEHPVLNDPLYGIKGERADAYGQYLHAHQLEFAKPTTGERVFLEATPDKTFSAKLAELGLRPDRAVRALEGM